jgi:hypothetical protein
MRKITAALLLSLALNAQASTENRSHENRPYTFDYFVHVDSGPKPTLIFGTGQTTYIQLPDGVEVQQVHVRKGKTQKTAEVFYSAPYTVVRELHDSLRVVTNKGSFTAERSGAKTEVELAAERAEIAQKERAQAEAKAKEQSEAAAKARELAETALKERETAEAKAKEQADEIAKLREELKAKQTLAEAKKSLPGEIAAAPESANALPGVKGERTHIAAVEVSAMPEALPIQAIEVSIRNGEGIRAALARESDKLGIRLSWSLKEDRIASRDMVFTGLSRDEVLNDILVAFRLPGYLVQSTSTLYIVKD